MFHISVNGRKSRKMDPEKRDERIGVWVLCCIYSVIAGFTTLGMSVALSQDISGKRTVAKDPIPVPSMRLARERHLHYSSDEL